MAPNIKSWAVVGLLAVLGAHQVSSQTEKDLPLKAIAKAGFKAQTYTVRSQDHFLHLYRIINPLADQKNLNKYPVLYGHGVLFDSESMISQAQHSRPRTPFLGQASALNVSMYSNGADDNALPFMFSNNNFDVWLFDARGVNTKAEKENMRMVDRLNPFKSASFWNFTLDEEALIDLPNLMEFVLKKTGSQKLVYVGYSESTWFMFALLSAAPEYADKLAAFVAMAPVAYVNDIRGLTLPLLAPFEFLPKVFSGKALPQFVLDGIDKSFEYICSVKFLRKQICSRFLKGVAGDGSSGFSDRFFRKLYKNTSAKVMKHFTQIFLRKKFAMYDYGRKGNLRQYGKAESPIYNLTKIRCDRIIFVRGLKDFLSTAETQDRIISELGSSLYKDIVLPNFNHFDFIGGKNLIDLVNKPVMEAVFELMKRDGPNLFMSPQQVDATAELNKEPTYDLGAGQKGSRRKPG